jgi:hypothetical protein
LCDGTYMLCWRVIKRSRRLVGIEELREAWSGHGLAALGEKSLISCFLWLHYNHQSRTDRRIMEEQEDTVLEGVFGKSNHVSHFELVLICFLHSRRKTGFRLLGGCAAEAASNVCNFKNICTTFAKSAYATE